MKDWQKHLYTEWARSRVKFRYEHGDVDYTKPRTKEELLRGNSFSDAMRAQRDPGDMSLPMYAGYEVYRGRLCKLTPATLLDAVTDRSGHDGGDEDGAR